MLQLPTSIACLTSILQVFVEANFNTITVKTRLLFACPSLAYIRCTANIDEVAESVLSTLNRLFTILIDLLNVSEHFDQYDMYFFVLQSIDLKYSTALK